MSAIVDKIRKLLALAKDSGATEAEAAQAMSFATRLMIEHGVSADAVADVPERVFEGGETSAEDKWHWYLIHAACKLYGTKPIRYVGVGSTRAKFVGRAANIEATGVTYAWLVSQVETLYKSALPKGMTQSERAEYRRNFKVTCAARVYGRARDIVAALADKGTEQVKALVVVAHQKQLEIEADDFIAGMNVKAGRKSRAVKLNSSALGVWEGHAAGDKIRLQQEIK